jgi:NAD(P)-dependent dehydrogenase (short-subunit alcohol dehydrogenase family)
MDKRALVTGASRGIGREVALGLGREGYAVLLAVREPARAPVVPGGRAEALDMGSPTAIDAVAHRLLARGDQLDVLVNNAALNGRPPKELWEVNVRGPLHLTRALAPLLQDGARVVMVSSGLGQKSSQDPSLLARLQQIRSIDDMQRLCDDAPGSYGATKAALNRLAELFAGELAPRHILVNAVSPGWCRTDMGGQGAPRSVEQGAESVLWGCRLGADGPTGGFFEDGRPLD